ncbi:MAG: VCBS repeat-containing protein, partial [Bacteroidia bacterium]|nr:VCBS repeat-containing protein [Bacteroidia bacterium]
MHLFRYCRIVFWTFLTVSTIADLSYGQSLTYSEVAGSLGIRHSYQIAGIYGGGATFYDFDQDGWDDITLASGSGDSIHFYKNQGGMFVKLPCFINNTSEAKSVIWVDYDNDGDKDLYVSSYLGTNRLYNNDGAFNFTDVTSSADLPLDTFPSFGASWADYDNDGLLDLYFVNRSSYSTWTYTNYLYRNLGNGIFENVTTSLAVGDGIRSPLCAGFFDYDQDGDQELYTALEMLGDQNSLFENTGGAAFIDVSAASGANIDIEAMCVAVGDYNGDSHMDIYVTNRITGNKLLQNTGSKTFNEVASIANVEMNSVGWGAWFLDADNDGKLDIYVSGSSPGT